MLNQLKGFVFLGVVAVIAYTFVNSSEPEQTADLGQVLDRTEYAILNYQDYLTKNRVEVASDDQVNEFARYLTQLLNNAPRFYDKQLGLEVQGDASFLGFADDNFNGQQDRGEGDVFTVEIDEANNRLIATDVTGAASEIHFSSAGFFTGALLGHLISRQRAAGITAASFNNRTATPRARYAAPTSARSGGLRSGK